MEMEYKLGPFVRCVRIGPKDLDGVGQETHKAWGVGGLGSWGRNPDTLNSIFYLSPHLQDRIDSFPSHHHPAPWQCYLLLTTPHSQPRRLPCKKKKPALTAPKKRHEPSSRGPHCDMPRNRNRNWNRHTDPGVVTGPFPACSRLRLKIGPPILLLTFLPSHGEWVGGCINMDERWESLGCSASSVMGRPFAACVLIAR